MNYSELKKLTLLFLLYGSNVGAIVTKNAEEHASHDVGGYHRLDLLANQPEVQSDNSIKYYIETKMIPLGREIDEVYIKLKPRSSELSKNSVINVANCAGDSISDISQFHAYEKNGSLYLAGNFITGEREIVYDTRCWSIQMSGIAPRLHSVEMVVTYHNPEPGNPHETHLDSDDDEILPDYVSYDYYTNGHWLNFDGSRTLSIPLPGRLEEEKSSENVVSARRVPYDTENLIVLIHGWNPTGASNKYAHQNNVNCPSAVISVNAENGMMKDLGCSWKYLFQNLTENSTIIREWEVSRYHWEEDANTGLILLDNNPLKANEVRDRAHVHGIRLGKIIESVAPKRVQFIAHSAGNWVARRAADYLKTNLVTEIELVALDPFVNNNDTLGSVDFDFDLNFKTGFEMSKMWLDSYQNYYVSDFVTDNIVGYTSNEFDGWSNIKLDSGFAPNYDDTFMNNHSGPIYWYARSVKGLTGVGLTSGFESGLPYRYSSVNCFNDISGYSVPVRSAICKLKNLGLLANNENFEGHRYILRQEFYKLVSKLSELENGRYTGFHNVNEFNDVVDLTHGADWSVKYFTEMLKREIISGEPINPGERKVYPLRNVTLGESMKSIVNVFKGTSVLKEGYKQAADHWPCKYESCINKEGVGWLLNGSRVDAFDLSQPELSCKTKSQYGEYVTRSEVVFFISNALELWGNGKNMSACFIPAHVRGQ